MKKMRILLVMAVAMFSGITSFAQGRFGADSANCVNYLNFYRDYLRQGNMMEAAPLWQKAMKSCPPAVSQNMYIEGQKILKYMIDKYNSDTSRKQQLIDSLMMVHERRAQYYPKYRLKAKENQVFDMISYFAQDDKRVFDALEEVIETSGEKVNPDLLVVQMSRAKMLYDSKKINEEDVLNTYSKLSPILESIVKANPSEENKERQVAFDNAFVLSGIANCENLVAVFSPRFEADPSDVNMVRSIAKLLSDHDCIDTDLFLQSVITLHELESSYSSARLLYKLHNSKNQLDLAVQYLQEAIDSPESDDAEDANMLLELATFQFKKQNQYANAVQTARQALNLTKDPAIIGRANLLIGTIWYQVKCSGNEIEQRAKFWVATDYLQKAKNADAELAEEANSLINLCRQYFPTTEDAFMYDLSDGNSFTVSCGGMSATTTVRTNK